MHSISQKTDKKTKERSRLTLEGIPDRISTLSSLYSKKTAPTNEFSTTKRVMKAHINSIEQSHFSATDNDSATVEMFSIS
jgi:hypothetical protein